MVDFQSKLPNGFNGIIAPIVLILETRQNHLSAEFASLTERIAQCRYYASAIGRAGEYFLYPFSKCQWQCAKVMFRTLVL